MTYDAFAIRLREFNDEFAIDMSLSGRTDKMFEELSEFWDACTVGKNEEITDEALDVLICAHQICLSRGIYDPFHFAALKLERNAEEYRLGTKVP